MELNKEINEAFAQYNNTYFKYMNKALKAPILYAMESGGKYFRPLLMAYSAEMFGCSYKKILTNAYGVELFHNFTLLHDDIMDNAELRRGKNSVFKQYGQSAAILSGDVMLIQSLKITAEKDGQIDNEIYNLMHQTAIEIHIGQQMDIDFEEMPEVLEQEYLTMITYKTAVLLACSLKIGAIIAETSTENTQLAYEFGKLIGIAFQIQDDYLDTFGTAKVGKRIGGDILNNKKTILYIAALDRANNTQKQRLLELYSTKDIKNEQAKIDEVVELFKETGAKQYCQNKIKELHENALSVLNKIEAVGSKKALQKIADKIISREE